VRPRDAAQIAAAGMKNVLVLCDADAVGRRGARTSIAVLRQHDVSARALDVNPLLDDGTDVADELRARDDGVAWLQHELRPFVEEARDGQ
jgi:hypothetical protein